SSAKIFDAVAHVTVGSPEEGARAAAGNSPHQRAILRVEFFHAFVGLDDLGSADADARVLRDDYAAAARSDDAAAPERAGASADEPSPPPQTSRERPPMSLHPPPRQAAPR